MEPKRGRVSPWSVMLITDGARAALGTSTDAWVAWAGPAIDAGLPLLQVREPGLASDTLAAIVRALVLRTAGRACRVVVNDRLDVAIAAGAHGVHLRGLSPAASRVRSCVPEGFLIGRSIHAPAEAAQAGPVDYLVAGAVFGSGDKPARGITWLRQVCESTPVPVIAVGGITPARTSTVSGCVAAGAVGVAAISCFLPPGTSAGAIGAGAATSALIELMAGCIHE